GEIVTVEIAYSQVLDRMYKGTLKDGMLDRFSPEQIEEMRRLIEEKKQYFKDTYAMMERISG
ncbi:MAG: hypothetical protein IKN50_02415, partial [Clostridia bacterium]|nr:hypothetical protein [Clostridia bacterium]